MKKIITLIAAVMLLGSCNWTTSSQDAQMLQTKYPVVYKINIGEYVTVDSADHVYHVIIQQNGKMQAAIRIK